MHIRRNAILVCLLSLGIACKEKAQEEPPAPGSGVATASEEAKDAAEKPAMAGDFALVGAMLALDDPVGAAALGQGSLRPEPIAGAALAELREAHEKAARELDGADVAADETMDAGVVAALRFAHARTARKLGEENPARSDLGYALHAARRFLDEAEYQAGRGPCECTEGLKALGTMLTGAGQELGASSLESLEAAQQDLGALRVRIEALPRLPREEDPGLAGASMATLAAVDGLSDLTGKRVEAMSSAEVGMWGQPISPAGDGTKLRKLPAMVGAKELARRLEVEEGIIDPANELFTTLVAGVGRIERLAGEKKLRLGPPREIGGSAVRQARCERMAIPIRNWAKSAKNTKAAIDCKAIVRKYDGAPATEAELTLQIMDSGVVEPTRRGVRRRAKLPMSLVGGNIVPTSQRDAATISMLLAVKNRRGLERAVQRALQDACLSAAALWYHGELGSEAELLGKLDGRCAWKKPGAWVAEAASRPRRALAGVGFVISGRKGIAMLNALWWAPLGASRIITDARTGAQSPDPEMPDAEAPPEESAPPASAAAPSEDGAPAVSTG